MSVSLALNGKDTVTTLYNCITFSVSSLNNAWSSLSVTAIVAPGLCTNILLGLPFLVHNKIVIDADACSAIHKPSGFDLLNEDAVRLKNHVLKSTPQDRRALVVRQRKAFLTELKWKCSERLRMLEEQSLFELVKPVNVITAVKSTIELLAQKEKFISLESELKTEFKEIFEPIPHVNELPMSETAWIQLKDAYKTISI